MKSIPDVEQFIGKAPIIGIAIADHSVSVANETRTDGDILAELVEEMGGGGYAEWKSVDLPPPSRVRIAWRMTRRWLGDPLVRAGEAIR